MGVTDDHDDIPPRTTPCPTCGLHPTAVERMWEEWFEIGSDHTEHAAAEERAKVARAALVVYRHARRVRALLDDVHDEVGWRVRVDELTGDVLLPESWERRVETLRDEYEEVERAMDVLESCIVQDGADMLEKS